LRHYSKEHCRRAAVVAEVSQVEAGRGGRSGGSGTGGDSGSGRGGGGGGGASSAAQSQHEAGGGSGGGAATSDPAEQTSWVDFRDHPVALATYNKYMVRRCRLTVSKPVLKAPMVSTISA
jgi:hypothetical protein